MTQLCFLTTCMGRLTQLRQTLPAVAAQRDSSCVVVDYSCPDRCGEWVEANYPQVRVVRIEGQSRFNRSIAANAGSKAVDAPWICIFDADVVFAPSFVEQALPLFRPGSFYVASPWSDPGIVGTFVCRREDFQRVDGFDEVYEGWGDSDLDMYQALQEIGLTQGGFSSSLLRHLEHDDASRVRFHEIKEKNLVWSINRMYRIVKFDLMRIKRGPLALAIRQSLYKDIGESVRKLLPDHKTFSLKVAIPPGVVMPEKGRVERALHYTFHKGD